MCCTRRILCAGFALLIILLISASQDVSGIPANPRPVRVYQPDGTSVLVRTYGDEFYHVTETIDGYVVQKNKAGWWVYTSLDILEKFVQTTVAAHDAENRLDGEWQFLGTLKKHLRESRSPADYTSKRLEQSTFSAGTGSSVMYLQSYGLKSQPHNQDLPIAPDRKNAKTYQVLILPVDFNEIPHTFSAQSFQDLVQSPTWEAGSMSDYYHLNSNGAMQIQADFQEWFRAPNPAVYYGHQNEDYSAHVKRLVRDAVDNAEAQGVDFSKYDNDGNGVVDGLFVVHSGTDASEDPQPEYIWAHASRLSNADLQVNYDGVTVNDYIMNPEFENGGHAGIGVFCHEYGHQLGLPDLYDTDQAVNGDTEAVGRWCIMAGGSWGADGKDTNRPAHLSAWCKEYLGWVTPVVLTQDQAITIRSNQYEDVFKVWLDPYRDDEYLLIENRQKTGFETTLLGDGLLIYHVNRDMSELYPLWNRVNAVRNHLGVSVLQADGLDQLGHNLNRGDAGDPFPGSAGNTSLTDWTNPNTRLHDGSMSYTGIVNISPSAVQMTADVTVNNGIGYSQHYYNAIAGAWGWPNRNLAYGLVRFTPSSNGKLHSVKIYTDQDSDNLQVRVYDDFQNGNPTTLLGSANVTEIPYPAFYDVTFNNDIIVQSNDAVYVETRYELKINYYQIPTDVFGENSGNCWISQTGSNYVAMPRDFGVRAVFSSDAQAANVPIIPVASSPQTPGSAFYVDIQVGDNDNPVTDLFGVSFQLNYPSANLDVVLPHTSNVITGDFLGSDVLFYQNVDEQHGNVHISVTRKSGSVGVNGVGNVARVKVVSPENTPDETELPFSISNVNAISSSGSAVALDPKTGTVIARGGIFVWPGDTDNSGIVDQADVLPIGQYWNQSGPARTDASLNWTGQSATAWTTPAATYADADGDGTVDQAEVLAIGFNWNRTHATSQQRIAGVQSILKDYETPAYLSIEAQTVQPGDREFWASVQISEVENLYGAAFCVTPTHLHHVRPVQVLPGDWMGDDNITFSRLDESTGTVHFGISLRDGGDGLTGSGEICRIRYLFPNTESLSQVTASFEDVVLVDPTGTKIPVHYELQSLLQNNDNVSNTVPVRFRLDQNYPNPFNPMTTIVYGIPATDQAEMVTLKVFNNRGELIRTLVHGIQQPGNHIVQWDGKDEHGQSVSAGMYLYRLKTESYLKVRKMVLMR